MATTPASENIDYSFSNNDKLIIHNQNSENKPMEENTAGPSSETNRVADEHDQMDTSQKKESISVKDAITKVETILQDLKKQDTSPENIRIIRDVSKKRSRKSRKKYASSPRSASSSDSSPIRSQRSPSPKRTKKDTPNKKYDSDSCTSKEERHRDRDSSISSLNSDRSYSCVSRKLKKELSGFLGNSFVNINSKRNERKFKKGRSRSPRRSDSNTRYSRRDSRYSRRERSRSRRDDSYDRYSKRKSTRRNSDRYNYNRHGQQVKSNDFEERYSRYYAVMYAFSIIMDILRQDDIYSTY